MRNWIIFLFILGGLVFFMNSMGLFQENARTKLPRGIDVSHHQGQIDWEIVKEENLDFVFVKATEGLDFVDPRFEQNWKALSAMGMKRGAYHFFRPNLDPKLQAAHFLNILGGQVGELPVTLDVEVTGGKKSSEIVAAARVWMEIVEKELGKKPILYTGPNFYNKHLKHGFSEYPLWLGFYSEKEPILEDGRQWTFWQYTSKGRMRGITGPIDINVFQGTHADLDEFCNGLIPGETNVFGPVNEGFAPEKIKDSKEEQSTSNREFMLEKDLPVQKKNPDPAGIITKPIKP